MKKGGVTTAGRRTAITKDELRRLRNDLPIEEVVLWLGLERRRRGGRVEVRCAQCQGFHVAIHEPTNLARCFRCARSYNPIDLIMTVRRASFLQAVEALREIESRSRSRAPATSRAGGRSST